MLEQRDLEAISELIKKSETMILDGMERYDRKNEKQFESIARESEKLNEIYRMTKSENDTINTLFRIIENLEKRVSELERKTA